METDNSDVKQERPWLFQKGVSGNPQGRPKGSKSLKSWVKDYLYSLTDEEKIDFLAGIPKTELWKMGEGNPHNTGDMKVELPPLPLDEIRKNNSVPEDKESQ